MKAFALATHNKIAYAWFLLQLNLLATVTAYGDAPIQILIIYKVIPVLFPSALKQDITQRCIKLIFQLLQYSKLYLIQNIN
jgi:hypothetical protein